MAVLDLPLSMKRIGGNPQRQLPFVLTTGRLYGHWHTQTRTGRIPKTAKMHPQPFLEMNHRDAQHLKVQSGVWMEVKALRGSVRLPILVTQNIRRGTLFVPMHWGALWADNAECNALTHPERCPISLEPELKACAVAVVPLGADNAQSEANRDASGKPTLPRPTQSSMLSGAHLK